ncbi:response regulator with CheY-like receiver, AAA-type ATPase, and DNA-binding domains [Desulfitobacterium dichloroeliminans LMG P-21439]|uniref:Stage 0 sporulation protein A homolog n=1 Tax=Desulfitobacterium dichloroeliminans (strain LMG P-21439 / DCA1) TaxID=871963 RepID=L0FCW9_DESDL|nr:response regulator [Desulfitobacterium dichloroeliminans]AGA70850.1 response regulator with CheY-like receiver, AAA-type ATPase, and DNA-binding domains [Desulfitobacterium dichloroeliminans LMG P-21439]
MANILVVDDQMGIRRLLFEAFKEEGHRVKMAENGNEALHLLEDFQPELIIMDMKMPEMNGIDTLKEIRMFNKEVQVIMMTAYGDLQTMERAQEQGVKCYISKPFDLFELRDYVRQILQ